jgi:hypothetical protein
MKHHSDRSSLKIIRPYFCISSSLDQNEQEEDNKIVNVLTTAIFTEIVVLIHCITIRHT